MHPVHVLEDLKHEDDVEGFLQGIEIRSSQIDLKGVVAF